MKWDATKYNWNHLRAFIATVEEGSLSAAARALGVSQPTLGRQVSALEQEIGVELFTQAGTGRTLTQSGQQLVHFARNMADAALEFSLAASGQSQLVEGTVCISTGELFAAHIMPPLINRLIKQEPGIEIELVASNESSDLKRREADIAIRANHASQPDLISIKVSQLNSRLYASKDYLDKTGRPKCIDNIGNCRFIGFDDAGVYMQFLNGLGLKLKDSDFPIRAQSHLVQWAMAKQGLGIVTVIEAVGDSDPAMERVFPEMAPIITPMYLVAHKEVITSRRISVVFDFLKAELVAL